MIATFAVEIALAVRALWRYRMSSALQLSVLTFVCLAVFQLAEFTICEGMFGLSQLTWAKIGDCGHHRASRPGHTRTGSYFWPKVPATIGASYAVMLAFMAYFLFSSQGITAATCGGKLRDI